MLDGHVPEEGISLPLSSSLGADMQPGLPSPGISEPSASGNPDLDEGLLRPEPLDVERGTFYQRLQIDVREPVGNMSISPAGRDVVLAARKGLFIIDLEHPYDPPRFMPQGGTWEVADVQWNPHPARAELIVSTSSQKLLIWNLYKTGPTGIAQILHAHYRAITDINWHAYQPDIIASCGIDSWIWSWDLRQGTKPAMGFCAWNASATQVKWNRQDEHILASSHDNNVLIWDRRKGSIPLITMQAHETKIYGIDWSRRRRNEIVTCSLDRTIKFWRFDDLSPLPHSPLDHMRPAAAGDERFHLHNIIQTTYPVWRARHLPFGYGVLSLPQRGEDALELWGYKSPENPIERFEGHTDVVKEFVWRTKGGTDLSHDDRQFQLITWSKDHTLRGWPIDLSTAKKVGFEPGASIKVLLSRRNAEDVTFRVPPATHPANKVTFSAPVGPRTILANVRATPHSTSETGPPFGSRERAVRGRRSGKLKRATFQDGGYMTRGHAGGNAKGRIGVDQMLWIPNVKLQDREEDVRMGAVGQSPAPSRKHSVSRATSVDASGRERRGRSTSRTKDGDIPVDIAQEMAAVAQTFSPKVKFEKTDLSARTCTISLHGPWLEALEPVFLRVTFTFPRDYPRFAGAESTPRLELEKNAALPLKSRAFLLKHLRMIRQQRRPCLEPCIRFLLGLPEGLFGRLSPFEDDSSGDEDGGQMKAPTLEERGQTLNMQLLRKGGASFGPNGELLHFSLPPPFRFVPHAQASRSPSVMSRGTNLSGESMIHGGTTGGFSGAVIGLSRLSSDQQTTMSDTDSQRRVLTRFDDNRSMQESTSARGRTRDSRASGETSERLSLRPTVSSAPTIFITDVSSLLPCDRDLAQNYSSEGTDLRKLCDNNANVARSLERADQERMWHALAAVTMDTAVQQKTEELVGGLSANGNGTLPRRTSLGASWLHNPMAHQVFLSLFWEALNERDIQMLGMMSCVILKAYHQSISEERPRARPELTLDFASKPAIDSFTLKSPVEIRVQIPSSIEPPKRISPELNSPSPQSVPSSGSNRTNSWTSLLGAGVTAGQHLLHKVRDSGPQVTIPPRERTLSQLSQDAIKGAPSLHATIGPAAIPIPHPVKSPYKTHTRSSKGPEMSPTALKSLPEPVKSFAGKMLSFRSETHRRDSGYQSPVLEPMPKRRIVRLKWRKSAPRSILSKEVGSFMTPGMQTTLEGYVTMYAELLMRWQLFHRRAQLWEACFPSTNSSSTPKTTANGAERESASLVLRYLCQRCHHVSVDPSTFICGSCRTSNLRPLCTVCRLPVAALDHMCLLCGHCTHQDCLKAFRERRGTLLTACPTGCGCTCDVSGAFSVDKSKLPPEDRSEYIPFSPPTKELRTPTLRGRTLDVRTR